MTSGPKTKNPPAVFFGSGPVAARCLELLLHHTEVEAVITKPRPAHHRGKTPVIDFAAKHGLSIITASTKQELDQVIARHTFSSRYAILIDFGIIVSQAVIDKFELGIINSHFSLLPHLRGADPITWSIAIGDEKTGVSLMLVDTGLDTGKLITSRIFHLNGNETTQALTQSLILHSDQLLQEYLPRYLLGDIIPRNQPHPSRATYSRKLTKADSQIDWNLPAIQIERHIRAFCDWPQSRTRLGNLELIITAAHVIDQSGQPGSYTHDAKELIVFAKEQALSIDRLKPAGKKEMPVQAFLAGYKSQI